MSEKKVVGINVPLIILGIILMLVGVLMLSLTLNEFESIIYGSTTLGSGGIFSDSSGATTFSLLSFIVFVVGLVVTEKQIVENRKTKSS